MLLENNLVMFFKLKSKVVLQFDSTMSVICLVAKVMKAVPMACSAGLLMIFSLSSFSSVT